ncbi:MAG: metalloendopeptidase-like rane protein [Verrucomicrobiaceae bacterium]|nr:metalloendopeptidase-like rane protein [Verrucomicrobiaceae bacterium]
MRYPSFLSFAPLALALLATTTHATTVFKYLDADGVTHYTDRNPAGKHNAEILQLWGEAPEQKKTVFIEKRGTPQQPELYVINQNQAPVEVSFQLTQQDNLKPQSIPAQWVVAGKSETKIATLLPQNAGAAVKYDYQMRWQLGDPRARPTANFAYSPPVPLQAAFTISQGFDGDYSHHTPGSRFAIDIGMPIGTGIRAARGGEVVSVQDTHGEGGDSTSFRAQTNSMYVLHEDGTFGVYAHLRKGSALVRVGQRIRAGQLLAQSGNTGYSTGPHLHFAVLHNAGLKWESIPFLLASPYGVVKPQKGMAITGMPLEQVAAREQ